jgi:prevent-host-death family protein
MFRVHVKPSRDLRNSYAKLTDILREHDQVIITNKGRGEAVLINIEDYADYEAYVHRRYIREKLAEAEAAAGKPDAVWLSHEEFWDDLEV